MNNYPLLNFHKDVGMHIQNPYGRRYRSLLYWDEVVERKILRPELVVQTKMIMDVIKKNVVVN